MSNLSFEQSKHLTVRTGLGPELEKIQAYRQLNPQQAIKEILNAPQNFIVIPPPSFTSYQELRQLRKSDKMKDVKDKEARKRLKHDRRQLKNWGIKQAILNTNGLQEKMTWFWHNHFTSSHRRAGRSINLMIIQDFNIRKNALGNFGTLLKDMAYDPMMLIYLDGISNKKGKPNENFARELLELFTLGEGHYTEKDIKGVARAFTGWVISGKTEQVRLNKKRSDQGVKTIFNQTDKFNSDDVLSLLLKHPRTAEFIAEKFWKEFINLEQPDRRTIVAWGKVLRDNSYEIKPLLSAVLNSAEFWDQNNRAKLIKSPLELVVGTLRSLDLEDKNLPLESLDTQLRKMKQDIYAPPNVKGWPGGKFWIDDTTLPIRQQFLRRLTRGNGNKTASMKMESTPMTMEKKKVMMPATDIPRLPSKRWERWLLPMKSVTPLNQKSPRSMLQAILLDPTYQLK